MKRWNVHHLGFPALQTFGCVLAITAYAIAGAGNAQQVNQLTRLALADLNPTSVVVDGLTVTLWEGATNEEARRQGHLQGLSWYYAVPPTIVTDSRGRRKVTVVPVRGDPDSVNLQLTIKATPVNRQALLTAVRQLDAFAEAANIQPVLIYGLDASMSGEERNITEEGNAVPWNGTLVMRIKVSKEEKDEFIKAIVDGAAIEVGYWTLVKTQGSHGYEMKWSSLQESTLYRNYFGPSGPQYIAASQAATVANTLLSSQNVRVWTEVGDGTAISTTSEQYRKMVERLVERAIGNHDLKEIALTKYVQEQMHFLNVPVGDFQKMVDVTTHIATDAKNLKNDEWCRKYADALKQTSDSYSSSKNSEAMGLNFSIGPFKLGGNERNSNAKVNSAKNSYATSSSNSDCGKKLVEDTYKYEFDGAHYVPKAIKVYEKSTVSSTSNVSEQVVFYEVGQRLARNVWTISQ